MYSESIFIEALDDEGMGIRVNEVTINNIRYANEAILLGNSIEERQEVK